MAAHGEGCYRLRCNSFLEVCLISIYIYRDLLTRSLSLGMHFRFCNPRRSQIAPIHESIAQLVLDILYAMVNHNISLLHVVPPSQ